MNTFHDADHTPGRVTIVGEPTGLGATITTGDRHHLASLGDLMEFVVDGWRIEGMHYADRSGPGGADGAPGAFFDLARGPEERFRLCIPDDGRALSHRSLVGMFRERPRIWKYRSPGSIPLPREDELRPVEEWGPVREPFPAALDTGPGALRDVAAVRQIQTVDGATVALTALERYEDGALARLLVTGPGADPCTPEDLLVVDDGGRIYRSAALAPRHLPTSVDAALAIGPAIPADARSVTVTVGTLRDGEGQTHPGPWVFPISLSGAR